MLTQHEYNTAFVFFATYYLRFLLLKFLWTIYQHSLLLSAKNPLTLAETVLQLMVRKAFSEGSYEAWKRASFPFMRKICANHQEMAVFG